MKKYYYLFFFKIVKAISITNKPHYRDAELEDGIWGATGILGIILVLFFILFIFLYEIFFEQILFDRNSNNIYYAGIIYIILSCSFIYYSIFYKNKWANYVKEFTAYTRSKDLFVNCVCVCIIVLVLVILTISYLVWNKKYDAGLILPY